MNLRGLQSLDAEHETRPLRWKLNACIVCTFVLEIGRAGLTPDEITSFSFHVDAWNTAFEGVKRSGCSSTFNEAANKSDRHGKRVDCSPPSVHILVNVEPCQPL